MTLKVHTKPSASASKLPPISGIPALPLAAAATWVGIALEEEKSLAFCCLSSQREWLYESSRWWCAIVSRKCVFPHRIAIVFGHGVPPALRQSNVFWSHQSYDSSTIYRKIKKQQPGSSALKETTVHGIFSVEWWWSMMKVAPPLSGHGAREPYPQDKWVLSLSACC